MRQGFDADEASPAPPRCWTQGPTDTPSSQREHEWFRVPLRGHRRLTRWAAYGQELPLSRWQQGVPVVTFQAIARNRRILRVVDSSHNSESTPFRIRVKTAVVHRRSDYSGAPAHVVLKLASISLKGMGRKQVTYSASWNEAASQDTHTRTSGFVTS